MAYDHLKTEQLANKIRIRKEFLNQVVNRVTGLVRKYGKVTKRDECHSHTRVVSELRNFGNFTFETDLGQTDFGGNDIMIWHHPGKSFREGGLDFAFDKEWTPVLDVYFQVKDEYEVKAFNEETNWQKTLTFVLKNQDKIAERIRKAQNKAKKKLVEWRQEDKEMIGLLAEAKKLGIEP